MPAKLPVQKKVEVWLLVLRNDGRGNRLGALCGKVDIARVLIGVIGMDGFAMLPVLLKHC
jgi:hypothetical protein